MSTLKEVTDGLRSLMAAADRGEKQLLLPMHTAVGLRHLLRVLGELSVEEVNGQYWDVWRGVRFRVDEQLRAREAVIEGTHEVGDAVAAEPIMSRERAAELYGRLKGGARTVECTLPSDPGAGLRSAHLYVDALDLLCYSVEGHLPDAILVGAERLLTTRSILRRLGVLGEIRVGSTTVPLYGGIPIYGLEELEPDALYAVRPDDCVRLVARAEVRA